MFQTSNLILKKKANKKRKFGISSFLRSRTIKTASRNEITFLKVKEISLYSTEIIPQLDHELTLQGSKFIIVKQTRLPVKTHNTNTPDNFKIQAKPNFCLAL